MKRRATQPAARRVATRRVEAVSPQRPAPEDLVRVLSQVMLMRWADRQGRKLTARDLESLAASVAQQQSTEPPRASDTASTILAAAMQLFLERGYEVSLDDIAAAARTTKPTIYFYYKDKKELFRAAMQAAADETPPALKPPEHADDLREGLLIYARAFRDLILSERNILTYRAALLHLSEAPDLGLARVRKIIQSTNSSLTEFFRWAIQAGKIRQLDPESLSEMFFASAAGQARTRRLMGMQTEASDRDERYLAQMIDCFIDGVAVDRPAAARGTRKN